jgi:hypothetical protein
LMPKGGIRRSAEVSAAGEALTVVLAAGTGVHAAVHVLSAMAGHLFTLSRPPERASRRAVAQPLAKAWADWMRK